MRMPLARRRLPMEVGAALFFIVHAVVLCSGAARGGSGEGVASGGTVFSIDRERRFLTVEASSGVINTFRLDDAVTLIFRGLRPLRIDELRPGMRIEIDYRRDGGAQLPTVTWIEVLEVTAPSCKD